MGYFLPLYTPNDLKDQNFLKMKNTPLEISSLYTCAPKIMITWCTVPDIWCVTDRKKNRWTNGQMDGWKKWHTEVAALLKNFKRRGCITNHILFRWWKTGKVCWIIFFEEAVLDVLSWSIECIRLLIKR